MKENNKWKYQGDSRYEKVWSNMQLLGIQDVTTDRQHKNGTIVWRLPMKGRGNTNIEYASFTTGYVRNQGNQCHSKWQINKRFTGDYEYYPDYEWCDKTQKSIKTGKFNRFRSKKCELIPIEIDRLEYMMKYVIKNEFIKRANYVQEGKFVPKWKHESLLCAMEAQTEGHNVKDVTVIIDGHKYKVI